MEEYRKMCSTGRPLGASFVRLDGFTRAFKARFESVLGGSWGFLGASWKRLGSSLGRRYESEAATPPRRLSEVVSVSGFLK